MKLKLREVQEFAHMSKTGRMWYPHFSDAKDLDHCTFACLFIFGPEGEQLRSRVRDVLSAAPCLRAHTSWDWTKLKLGGRSSIWSSHSGDRGPSTWDITRLFPRCMLVDSWNWFWDHYLNPGTSVWAAGIPRAS